MNKNRIEFVRKLARVPIVLNQKHGVFPDKTKYRRQEKHRRGLED